MTRHSIGVDIGGTTIKFGLVSSEGDVRRTFSRPTEDDPVKMADIIQTGVRNLLQFSGDHDISIDHIGIDSPGAVNCETGLVFGATANIPNWKGTNLKEILGDFGYPVYADNDANAGALGEMVAGAGKGFSDILYVTIGTGVGGGIIINGKIHHGANYSAAEIGHIIIHPGGRQCGCGNKGCMEQYASVTGMMMTAKQILSRRRSGALWREIDGDLKKLEPEMITAHFNNDDEVALEIINHQAEALSQGVAAALNQLNPELLIIGGAISETGRKYISRLSKAIKSKVFPAVSEKLRIARAKLGGKAGTVGAAFLGWIR